MATKKKRRRTSRPAPLTMPRSVVLIEDPEKLRHGLGLIAGEAENLQKTLDALAVETRTHLDEVRERVSSLTGGRFPDLGDDSPAWMKQPSLRHRQTVLTALANELATRLGRLAFGAKEIQKQLPALARAEG